MTFGRALVGLASLVLVASSAPAATVSITPERAIYRVGETMRFEVIARPEDTAVGAVFNRVLYDEDLADFVAADQQPWTTWGIAWSELPLLHSEGAASVFNQIFSVNLFVADDGPFTASLELVATAPGVFGYALETEQPTYWHSGFREQPTYLPAPLVTIVPEPGTAFLVSLGLLALARSPRRRRRA